MSTTLSYGDRFDHGPILARSVSMLGVIVAHVLVILLLLQYGAPPARTISGTPVQVVLLPAQESMLPEPQVPAPQLETQAIHVELPVIDLNVAPSESKATSAITAASSPARQSSEAASEPRVVDAVEYVREPRPRYPPVSKRLREEGLVVFRVLIGMSGEAREIELQRSSGHPRLDQAGRDAVARAAFKPYLENGRPQAAIVLIPIEFSLTRTARRSG